MIPSLQAVTQIDENFTDYNLKNNARIKHLIVLIQGNKVPNRAYVSNKYYEQRFSNSSCDE